MEGTVFHCPGCGRHMEMIVPFGMDPMICLACLCRPGWYQYPSLVEQVDPDNQRDRNRVTMTMIEIECRATWFGKTLEYFALPLKVLERPIRHEPGWVH